MSDNFIFNLFWLKSFSMSSDRWIFYIKRKWTWRRIIWNFSLFLSFFWFVLKVKYCLYFTLICKFQRIWYQIDQNLFYSFPVAADDEILDKIFIRFFKLDVQFNSFCICLNLEHWVNFIDQFKNTEWANLELKGAIIKFRYVKNVFNQGKQHVCAFIDDSNLISLFFLHFPIFHK